MREELGEAIKERIVQGDDAALEAVLNSTGGWIEPGTPHLNCIMTTRRLLEQKQFYQATLAQRDIELVAANAIIEGLKVELSAQPDHEVLYLQAKEQVERYSKLATTLSREYSELRADSAAELSALRAEIAALKAGKHNCDHWEKETVALRAEIERLKGGPRGVGCECCATDE